MANGNGVMIVEGSIVPDTHPVTVADKWVKRVHVFDIPVTLREHAHNVLSDLSGDEWWTVGELRYSGQPEYDTAVARRVLRNGRMAVEFGIESE